MTLRTIIIQFLDIFLKRPKDNHLWTNRAIIADLFVIFLRTKREIVVNFSRFFSQELNDNNRRFKKKTGSENL